MIVIPEWKRDIDKILNDGLEIENYVTKIKKLTDDKRLFVQALFLDAFWIKYKYNPKNSPASVLKEVLRIIPEYELKGGLNPTLFDALVEKNNKLIAEIKADDPAEKQKALDLQRQQDEQQRLAAKETQEKIQKEKSLQERLERKTQRNEEEEKRRLEELEKQQEAQRQQEIEKQKKTEEEKIKRAQKEAEIRAKVQQIANMQESKQNEWQQTKPPSKKRKKYDEKQQTNLNIISEQKNLWSEVQSFIDVEEKSQDDDEELALSEDVKTQESQLEKNKEKIDKKENKKLARINMHLEKQAEEIRIKKELDDKLEPYREARNALANDNDWRIESFVNCFVQYQLVSELREDYLNDGSKQVKLLLYVISFMKKHAKKLEEKNLKDILREISDNKGGLKAAAECKNLDLTFLLNKRKVKVANTVNQQQSNQKINDQQKHQNENSGSYFYILKNNAQAKAFAQSVWEVGYSCMNATDLSTIFLLSTFAYAGGFFANKVIEQAFKYSALSDVEDESSSATSPSLELNLTAIVYSASTMAAFTPYANKFHTVYKHKYSALMFEKAKSALIENDAWDIELFKAVVKHLVNSKLPCLSDLKGDHEKIIFLKKILKVYAVFQRYNNKCSYLIDDHGGLLLEHLVSLYGNLKTASEKIIFLGEEIKLANEDFTKESIKVNNHLVNRNENPLSSAGDKVVRKFISSIEKQTPMLELYKQMRDEASTQNDSGKKKMLFCK